MVNASAEITLQRSPRAIATEPSLRVKPLTLRLVVGVLLLHGALALLGRLSPMVGLIHVFLTIGLGFWWTSFGQRLDRVACWGAYIVGSEVFWRMTQVPTFWETGKYLVSAVFLMALYRNHCLNKKTLPILYFTLLIPSCMLTFFAFNFSLAQGHVSFNLSGPFSLMCCVLFFSSVKLSAPQLRYVFFFLVGPIFSIACTTLVSTASASRLEFNGESNMVTSGGFGPNQVASILGLGALFAFLLFIFETRRKWAHKLIWLGLILFFCIQSALTFSRGGLYNFVIGALLTFVCLLRNPRLQIQFALLAGILLLITYYVVLPRLDTFTEGALAKRFTDTDSTGRESLVMADFQIWQEHPFLGAGPGASQAHRRRLVKMRTSHTEFSRLVSEHGALGFGALLILVILTVQAFLRARPGMSRAVSASLIGWSFFYMLNAAMRTAAPGFAFGLAFVTVIQKAPMVRYLRRRQNMNNRLTKLNQATGVSS